MSKIENVLVVPADFDGRVDPVIDRVVEDPDVDRPKVRQEKVPDEGQTALDRDFVTKDKKEIIARAVENFDEAAANSDTAGQAAALEVMVSHIWDVVSGEDVGSALLEDDEDDE